MEDRKPFGGLTADEVDHIAERAAEKALNRVYQEVGKGVLRKMAWILGLVVIGLFIWLSGKNLIR